MRIGWFDRNIKWVFSLPVVLFVLVMMAFPIGYTIRMSFFDWNMSSLKPPKWVGFGNYMHLLADERFWHTVKVTAYFTFSALAIETILGVVVALFFSRQFRGKNAAKTLLILPMVATPVAIALVWMLIFEPTIGLANIALKSVGLPPQVWLGLPSQVIPSLVLIDVWHATPMIAIIVIAGLTTLPADPYESASIDGASAWQKLIYITLPLIRPTILIAAMLRLIELLKQFDIIYATTQGGPHYASETLNIYGYILAFQHFKLGAASSLIMLFFLLVLSLTIVVTWSRKRLGGDAA